MSDASLGLLGATSLVGNELISLLNHNNRQVHAFSRRPPISARNNPIWHKLDHNKLPSPDCINDWLSAAPIWVLEEHFDLLESFNIRRIVALSSTSRFTKIASTDTTEKRVATQLIEGEERLIAWASAKDIEWVILRPTLIYGCGLDKNISQIAKIISKFGFFPLLGKASGLRQPLHVKDVAEACTTALHSERATNRAYNISGAKTVTYRDMVCQVFTAMQRPPRLLTVSLPIFTLATACIRLLPKYRHWSVGMAERMNNDQIFDHSDATRDFNFSPQAFRLQKTDLPQ